MKSAQIDIKEFHWLMDMLQTIDVGLVVLDTEYNIQVWNGFMESHSGMTSLAAKDKNIFDLFSELPRDWLTHKTNSVFVLKNRSFMTWEQRPYLFKFKNYRPITGTEPYMYQNITISPLVSTDGSVNHIAIIIYDVTDIASNRNALEKANTQLEKISRTDKLTQLNNRGYWEECLSQEFSRFKRYNTTCSVVMFDIDHFKKVNDTFGHQAGDEVIRQVAKILTNNLRKTDIAGRYGGEEFGVILGNTNDESSLIFCERVREEIEALEVIHDKKSIKFTVSLGVSQAMDTTKTYQEWLEQADQSLYVCKENGRNQSCIFKHS